MNEIIEYLFVTKLKRNEYFLKEGQVWTKVGCLNAYLILHFYRAPDNEVTRWISLNDFVTSLRSFIS